MNLGGESIERLVILALPVVGDKGYTQRQLADLAATVNARGFRDVGRVIDSLLQRTVGRLFEHGWLPADVAHLVRRATSQRTQRYVVGAIAAHARQHDAVHRAPAMWLDQLEALGAYDSATRQLRGGHADPFAAWARAERLHEEDATLGGMQALASLTTVPGLERLGDPPSAWGATNRGSFATARASTGPADAKALQIIRALLAKAEATDFEAEAATFTAKAQELMTRHSIDAAILASTQHGGSTGFGFGVEIRRIHIDNPYADEKALLLAVIAGANGVRAVWSSSLGHSTVVGTAVDLQLTDLLFTSLLVQATNAAAEATRVDRSRRSASFRRAFLSAYADRIGERLEDAQRTTASAAAADYGEQLLPILAGKRAAVDERFEQAFPHTTSMRSRSFDAAGWYAGRAAADRAHLGAGEAITRG